MRFASLLSVVMLATKTILTNCIIRKIVKKKSLEAAKQTHIRKYANKTCKFNLTFS